MQFAPLVDSTLMQKYLLLLIVLMIPLYPNAAATDANVILPKKIWLASDVVGSPPAPGRRPAITKWEEQRLLLVMQDQTLKYKVIEKTN